MTSEDRNPEDRMLAAELAIGLLTHDERAQAQHRAATDPAFAEQVEWWERQFAPLFDRIDEVAPPAYLAERIAARLDVPTLRGRQATPRWRFVAAGGALGALAASLVAWVTIPSVPVPVPSPPADVARPAPLLVASLAWSTKSAVPAPAAIVDPATRTLRLSAAVDVPAGRVGQLWRIPAGGKPASLGLVPGAPGRPVTLDRTNVPASGETVAVSVEPAGGSPTGQPTGPVILTGTLAAV